MGYNYTDCLEIVAMDKLHCGLEDLEALVPIYSDLAELSGVDFRVLGSMHDLKVMAEYSFTTMRNYIAECIRSKADRTYIELVPDDEDKGYVKYKVDSSVKYDLNRLADKLESTPIYMEELKDIKFNSIIDEAIDWESYESYPDDIADRILQLAYDEGIIKAKEEYLE